MRSAVLASWCTLQIASQRWMGLVVGGAGVAVLGGGIIAGVVASGHWSDAKRACGGDIKLCQPGGLTDAQTDVADARTAAGWATGLVSVGLGLTATGAIMYVIAAHTESQPAVQIAPSVGAHGMGLVLSGTL
jgi:hypothetical protein